MPALTGVPYQPRGARESQVLGLLKEPIDLDERVDERRIEAHEESKQHDRCGFMKPRGSSMITARHMGTQL